MAHSRQKSGWVFWGRVVRGDWEITRWHWSQQSSRIFRTLILPEHQYDCVKINLPGKFLRLRLFWVHSSFHCETIKKNRVFFQDSSIFESHTHTRLGELSMNQSTKVYWFVSYTLRTMWWKQEVHEASFWKTKRLTVQMSKKHQSYSATGNQLECKAVYNQDRWTLKPSLWRSWLLSPSSISVFLTS